MQDEDTDRAVLAAQDYVNNKMQPADLVALVSLSTGPEHGPGLYGEQAALLKGLRSTTAPMPPGFAGGGDGTTDGTSDDASEFFGRRHRVQRAQHRPRAARDPHHCEEPGARRSAQVDAVLFGRADAATESKTRRACVRRRTKPRARTWQSTRSTRAGLQALPPVGDASKGSLRGKCCYTAGKAKCSRSSTQTLLRRKRLRT